MSALGVLAPIIDELQNNQAGPNPVFWDDLVGPLSDIGEALKMIAQVFESADTQASNAVQAATDAATQIEVIGQNVKDITHRLIETIMPHTVSWTLGYVWSHGITPLNQRVGALEDAVAKLQQWQAEIMVWRAKFVDPNVELWIGFRQWFDGWPRGILFRWHDYFDNPGNFAEWATPPLVGPIVAYLAAREHMTSRDNLARIMVDAWTEVPNDVWESILRWSVTEK